LSINLMAVLSQILCPLATGKGRMAAYEFMVVTPAISNLIRENKSYRIELEEMLDKARQPGALQDKAMAKLKGLRARQRAEAMKKDVGPVLRT
jgi:Tfp pilus assembly pilus retraction ATPase PilT